MSRGQKRKQPEAETPLGVLMMHCFDHNDTVGSAMDFLGEMEHFLLQSAFTYKERQQVSEQFNNFKRQVLQDAILTDPVAFRKFQSLLRGQNVDPQSLIERCQKDTRDEKCISEFNRIWEQVTERVRKQGTGSYGFHVPPDTTFTMSADRGSKATERIRHAFLEKYIFPLPAFQQREFFNYMMNQYRTLGLNKLPNWRYLESCIRK